MENLFYEAKPYLLMGFGGGAQLLNTSSTVGLICAFTLGILGGLILGMRFISRR